MAVYKIFEDGGGLKLKFLIMTFILWASMVFGMDTDYYPLEEQKDAVKVFIEYGHRGDTERYFRTEIPFVDHVRDPYVAQVHVLITDIRTGSGGRKFNLSFIGKDRFKGKNQELFHISPQSDTADKRREGLAQIIKMGLMPYVSQTSLADQVDINYQISEKKQIVHPTYDNWDYWIFNIDLGGGGRAEESTNAFNVNSSIRANRVTEEWKTRNGFYLRYEEENFSDEEESLKSILKNWSVWSSLVKSLSDKWSAGLSGNVSSTTFRNIRLGVDFAPAIEYNFFPWQEAERRQFTIGYRIGLQSLEYFEVTIYDRLEEILLFHSLDFELEMTEPWGEIDFDIEARQFPTLKNSYSIKLDMDFSFRLSSAFSFFVGSRLEQIHDQVYLPKGDLTIDEILLRRKQLATTYDIRYRIGIRFTFGSIYNNVVNHRL
jgi:hypothetical protein